MDIHNLTFSLQTSLYKVYSEAHQHRIQSTYPNILIIFLRDIPNSNNANNTQDKMLSSPECTLSNNKRKSNKFKRIVYRICKAHSMYFIHSIKLPFHIIFRA